MRKLELCVTGECFLPGYDFQLPLDQGLPPCHSLSPGAQSHSLPGALPGGNRGALGGGLARCPTAQQGAPHSNCPSASMVRMQVLGLVQAFWPWVGGGGAYLPHPHGFLG